MPRRSKPENVPPLEADFDLWMTLLIGPPRGGGEHSDEELKAAWEAHRARIMDGGPPGTRPWGFWRFEIGEETPEDEATRLAELGVLTEAELGALKR